MNSQVKSLFEKARELTPSEREELAELLLDTLAPLPEIEEIWSAEAERRWNDHVASGEAAVDAFAAVDQARRQLKRRDES